MLILVHLARRPTIPCLNRLSADNRRRIGYLLELSSMRLASREKAIRMQAQSRALRAELEQELGPPESWPRVFLNHAEKGLRMRGENDDLAKRWRMADSLSLDRMKSEMPAAFRR